MNSYCCKKCRKRVNGNGAQPFYVCKNVRCECHTQLVDRQIRFIRNDGSLAVNSVVAGGYDPKNGEVIFHEVVGFSGDVKGGVYVDGKEKFKRILIQRVFPVVEG